MARIIFILLLLCSIAQAATLTDIRVASYPQKIRVVFDFEGQAFYGIVTSEGQFLMALVSCEVSPSLGYGVEVQDWVIRRIDIEQKDGNLLIKIPLSYPVGYQLYPLSSPNRLVLDFGRTFTKIELGGKVADGVEYFGVVKGVEEGYVTAQILKIDPSRINIYPALASTPPGFFDQVADFFNPWAKKKRPVFSRAKVSDIVAQQGAAAGINGTYFDYSGIPLGVLMMAGEIVAYPIYDRTALILTEDHEAFIDNVILDSYFEMGGIKYEVTGINEPLATTSDIILFTRYFGSSTSTNGKGFEISVENGKVVALKAGNSRIPENGYVLSMGQVYAEYVSSIAQVGEDIATVISMIPYSTSPQGRPLHMIGGGPRLLKGGRVYISKYEEKFRRDIAKGRAARTAVGIIGGNQLLFVTVDGRPRTKKKRNRNESVSMGMSLEELAYFMLSLGARDALNLDGGGSSTMVIRDKVMNRPADGSQRSVSNAIILKKKK